VTKAGENETPLFSATAELFLKSRTGEKKISFSLEVLSFYLFY
jgi:hypothetical protein